MVLLEACCANFESALDRQTARYTSQKCSRCGYIARPNRGQSRFRCKRCGFEAYSDLNAAINIRDNYILPSTDRSEGQAAVNQPM